MGRVNSTTKTLALSVLDYVAPQCCIYCDQPSHSSEAVCEVCRDALSPNTDPCPRCALPGMHGRLCPACLAQPPAFRGVTAPYVYDAALAFFMHRWKYQGEQRLSRTAAIIMLKEAIFFENIDYLLATPLHWRRQLRRGFNQSEDLRRALCSLHPSLDSAPARTVRLSRRKATPRQARATRRERLANLNDAFRVQGKVCGHSIGLVDDVCTTGATGNAMAQILLEAGAADVHLYCLARTPSP